MTAKVRTSLAKPKAILFDCYETLFGNDPADWQATFAQIAAELKLPVQAPELWTRWKKYERQFRQLRMNVEDPSKSPPFKCYEQAWSECFQQVFDDLHVKASATTAGRRSVEHMGRRPPYPETTEALKALEGRVKLGVFSNADEAFLRPLVAQTCVKWDAVASSESAKVYKPAAGAFRHLLGMLGVRPDEAWYVGDHLFDDVLGARSVGLTAIWINRNGRTATEEPFPDVEINDLRELSALLDTV